MCKPYRVRPAQLSLSGWGHPDSSLVEVGALVY